MDEGECVLSDRTPGKGKKGGGRGGVEGGVGRG